MHIRVMAFDYDGTLAQESQVTDSLWELLQRAKEENLQLLLVTGRRLEALPDRARFEELCAAIIAENGAVIYYPSSGIYQYPFGHLPPDLVDRFRFAGFDVEIGRAIVATWIHHEEQVAAIIFHSACGVTLSFNKGALMILPPGATKGAGLRVALRELGYSCRNALACGDAENDFSLFEAVEYSVAVGNAHPQLKALADHTMSDSNGMAIHSLLQSVLDRQLLPSDCPRDRWIQVGRDHEGRPVWMSPFKLLNQNLGIFGSSGTGKSWLAGWIAEQLIERGYQLCLLDPEGDYHNLRAFTRTIVLGDPYTRPPSPAMVVTLLEYAPLSVIVDLSTLNLSDKISYGTTLLRALHALKAQRGIPHWILIDEAQYFCPKGGSELGKLLESSGDDGGIGLVSYAPSHISSSVLQLLQNWMVMPLSQEREVQTITDFAFDDQEVISSLRPRQYYLHESGAPVTAQSPASTYGRILHLDVAKRSLAHVRHLHKYLMAPLPNEKRFYFRAGNGSEQRTAASLWEFRELIPKLTSDTVHYHLTRGDFERWISGVFHDEELAQRIHKLANRPLGKSQLKASLLSLVTNHYEELERLI